VIESILEMMLLLPVKINLRQQLPQHIDKPMLSAMGDCRLGIDLTTGNAVFDEGSDELLVSIGPAHNKTLKPFMPGGKSNIILQSLLDYLLPVHLDMVTEFILTEDDKLTRLADVESELNAVLGEDTYL
jgi:predicted component of type VI protein secretion system